MVERGGKPSGLLSVNPMNQCLMRLASQREADRLLVIPGPRDISRLGNAEGLQQVGGGQVERREQLVATGPFGLLVVLGVGRSVRDDVAPETLDLREVPQEVGRRPVGTGGNRRGGIAFGEDLTEPGGLAGDV